MATRASIKFKDSDGKFIANVYHHYDGYPEGVGVEIAECFTKYGKIYSWEIENLNAKHGDLDYIYYVWQHLDKSTWISIFKWSESFCPTCGHPEPDGGEPMYECIFVGEPMDLRDKIRDGKIV